MKGAAAYPSYKNSGSGWLGDVPAHWDVKRGAAFLREKRRKNDPLVSENYLSLMANRGVIPYAEKGDVGNKKPEDLTKCKLVSSGDFVLNSMNYAIGSYGVSKYDGICSPVYVIMSHNAKVVAPEYVDLILSNSSYQKYAQSFGTGILDHRRAIGWDEIKKIPVAIPPIEEQVEIASYIGQKTTRIDSLVERKTQFIELLKEKRQAVIANAVTKGLDLSAQTKESGVEWIGRIPTSWIVKPLFSAAKEVYRSNKGMVESNLLSLSYGKIVRRDINAGEGLLPESFETYQIIEDGEIVMRLTDLQNDQKSLRTALTTERGIVTSAYVVIRPSDSLNSEYLAHLMRAYDIQKVFYSMGGGMRQSMKFADLRRLPLLIPSLQEQYEICSFLVPELARIDQLVTKTERSIELLREHRSALITAAVTGKIDVRKSK